MKAFLFQNGLQNESDISICPASVWQGVYKYNEGGTGSARQLVISGGIKCHGESNWEHNAFMTDFQMCSIFFVILGTLTIFCISVKVSISICNFILILELDKA